jgi:hypothetical protein
MARLDPRLPSPGATIDVGRDTWRRSGRQLGSLPSPWASSFQDEKVGGPFEVVTPAIVPRVKQWDDQSRERVQPLRPGVLANDIALPARGGEILEIVGLERRRQGPAPGRPRQDVIDGEGPAADATVFAAEARSPFDEAPDPWRNHSPFCLGVPATRNESACAPRRRGRPRMRQSTKLLSL